MTQTQTWTIRPALPDELNLLYATWSNSFRGDSSVGKSCTTTIFFAEYFKVIDHILEKPTTKVIVACFPDTPNVVLGYMVYEPGTLHYCFTKEIYRNAGIAKSLFEHAFDHFRTQGGPIYHSHQTFTAMPIIQKYQRFLTHDPFRLYEKAQPESKKDEILEELASKTAPKEQVNEQQS
jgi:GNAT superfamily N-acetyltransferase